jgi:hypothetical protein
MGVESPVVNDRLGTFYRRDYLRVWTDNLDVVYFGAERRCLREVRRLQRMYVEEARYRAGT